MLRKWPWILPVCAFLLSAGDQPWKHKKVPEWTEDDAKLVMDDSPWAKHVTPQLSRGSENRTRSGGTGRGGGMGRGGGINIGGIGIGIPGLGRRGGYPGGGYPGGGYPSGGGAPQGRDGQAQSPPVLALRWESALPIREAELKTGDDSAPTVDEAHYAIAVYGVPPRLDPGDSKSVVAALKKQAVLERDGKKDIKPSSVEVIERDDGPVIVYSFPRSAEITKSDRRVEFTVQIGRLKFSEPFFTEDMVYDGKLEL
jgi:hypothetical protein